MKKLLVSIIAVLTLVGCTGDSKVKDFLEERTDKVVNIIEVSDKRDYLTADGWDNGKIDIQDGVYSYRVKYSVDNDIYYDDVVFEKETNKPYMLGSELSK